MEAPVGGADDQVVMIKTIKMLTIISGAAFVPPSSKDAFTLPVPVPARVPLPVPARILEHHGVFLLSLKRYRC